MSHDCRCIDCCDREWLEGYTEAARIVHRLTHPPTWNPRFVMEMISAFAKSAFSKVATGGWLELTPAQKGHCDAWLDSIGC